MLTLLFVINMVLTLICLCLFCYYAGKRDAYRGVIEMLEETDERLKHKIAEAQAELEELKKEEEEHDKN